MADYLDWHRLITPTAFLLLIILCAFCVCINFTKNESDFAYFLVFVFAVGVIVCMVSEEINEDSQIPCLDKVSMINNKWVHLVKITPEKLTLTDGKLGIKSCLDCTGWNIYKWEEISDDYIGENDTLVKTVLGEGFPTVFIHDKTHIGVNNLRCPKCHQYYIHRGEGMEGDLICPTHGSEFATMKDEKYKSIGLQNEAVLGIKRINK